MHRIKILSKKYRFDITLMPIDIFEIFKENGTKFSLKNALPIQKNRIHELKRWKKYLGIKLNISPKYWPVDYKLANKLQRRLFKRN